MGEPSLLLELGSDRRGIWSAAVFSGNPCVFIDRPYLVFLQRPRGGGGRGGDGRGGDGRGGDGRRQPS